MPNSDSTPNFTLENSLGAFSDDVCTSLAVWQSCSGSGGGQVRENLHPCSEKVLNPVMFKGM